MGVKTAVIVVDVVGVAVLVAAIVGVAGIDVAVAAVVGVAVGAVDTVDDASTGMGEVFKLAYWLDA